MPIRILLLTMLCALIGAYHNGKTEPPHPVPRYTIIDIGTLGGAESEAWAINDGGVVVGWALTAQNHRHAFAYYPHGYVYRATGDLISALEGPPVLKDLSRNKDEESEARGINRDCHVVGFVWSPTGQRAVHWSGLFSGSLGPGTAYGINSSKQVVGTNLFLKARDESLLAHYPSMPLTAYGVNDLGQIVGVAERSTVKRELRWAFLQEKSQIRPLFPEGKPFANSVAYAINNKGQVVGEADGQAFLWEKGKTTLLGTLQNGPSSVAYALNEAGQVVGTANISFRDQALRAVLWQDGKMTDLNTRIDPRSGWTLEVARGVNAKGQICGTGVFQGKRRAFLLTPIVQK